MDARRETNPFLMGYYRPVSEELDLTRVPVIGSVPSGLRGMFLRNGPNAAFEPRGAYHPFDGDGMLHRIRVTDEGVSYRNRYVDTPGLALERRLGRAAFSGFAELGMPEPEALREVGMVKHVANTHIVEHAGKLLALWEGGMPYEVDGDLETLGLEHFSGDYRGPFTAHPCLDAHTGEMFAFGYNATPPFLTLLVVGPDGRLRQREVIDIPKPVMMHDFALSASRVVFLDSPAHFDVVTALRGDGPIIQWKPEFGCRIGVMPRGGSNVDVRWFEVEPFYAYHFMNAHDDGERVILDAARLDAVNTFGLDDLYEAPSSRLSRFTIDLQSGTVEEEVIDARPIEFPRVPSDRVTLAQRFGYGASFSGKRTMADYDISLRYDFETGRHQHYFHGPGRYVGELAFAPDPEGVGEEAGWLVGFVYDSDRDASDFVVLDTRDIPAGPVARAELPCRVPSGIHCSWIAGS